MSDMRDEFEKWFSDNHVKAGETINLQMKAYMWAGWQAARAQGDAEPVVWVSNAQETEQLIDGRPRRLWWECKEGVGTPFYTHPPSSGVPEGFALVPIEPTQAMVDAAEDAHMPFGDMDLALRMAILAAPAVQEGPTRDDLIQCLLATRGQSEGVTADAILSMLTAAPVVQGEPEGVRSLLVECERALCCPDPTQRQVTASKVLRVLTAAPAAPDVQVEPVGAD